MIASVADVSAFLHRWHGVREGCLALADRTSEIPVAPPLAEAWRRIGQLTVGTDAWRTTGESAPLACQDGLAGPGWTRIIDRRVDFAFENQSC